MKGLDRLVAIEIPARHNSAARQAVTQNFRLLMLKQISDHAHQDKGDGHERAVGDERVGNDGNEDDGDDDAGARTKLESFVFRRGPS